jgi:hypothetical protein
MTLIRTSRILGAALLVGIASPAAVGDPLAASPPDLGQALCSVYGAGFQEIPGTDTCLRVGGRVRVDSGYVGGDFGSSASSNTTSTAEGRVRIETRTQTDFGMVRIVIDKKIAGPDDP